MKRKISLIRTMILLTVAFISPLLVEADGVKLSAYYKGAGSIPGVGIKAYGGGIYYPVFSITDSTGKWLDGLTLKLSNGNEAKCSKENLAEGETMLCYGEAVGKNELPAEIEAELSGEECEYGQIAVTLENSGFESGTVDGWGPQERCSISPNENLAGADGSYLAVAKRGDYGAGYCKREVEVESGKSYILTLSAGVTEKSSSVPPSITISYIDSDGKPLNSYKAVTELDASMNMNELKKYTLSLPVAPEEARGLRIEANTGYSSTLYIDDAELFSVQKSEICNKFTKNIKLQYLNRNESRVRVANVASLGNYVWYDRDVDGIQDAGEGGIRGIRVHLYKDGVDTGEMTTTDASGYYHFDNLEPNHRYSVKVDLPLNYKGFTLQNRGDDESLDSDADGFGMTDEVVLKAGENYSDMDIGLVCKCVAWIDIEKSTNGEDADKAPGPNIKTGDTVTWTYLVENSSKAKICDIKVTDNKEGDINCPQDCLEAGESMTCTKTATAVEGQYENMATVTGKDPNGGRVADEDPSHYFGMNPQIDIEKYTNGEDADDAPGPKLTVGDKVTWTYIVKNTGNVKLTDVRVKDDREGIICEGFDLDVGEQKTCTKEGIVKEGNYSNMGTAEGKAPDGNDTNDTDTSHYEGLTNASLGDYYWYDENLNGIQDSGEPGIVGIKVELYDGNGHLLRTTETDSTGHYLFTNLPAGNYRLKFEIPDTYLFTLKDKGGDDAKDSDADSAGWTDIITLQAGEHDRTWDVGIYCECDDYEVKSSSSGSSGSAPSLSPIGVALLLIFTILMAGSVRGINKES